ncbi:MAG: hypothetical protein ACE5ER_00065 [Nitrospinaceae bacterium]
MIPPLRRRLAAWVLLWTLTGWMGAAAPVSAQTGVLTTYETAAQVAVRNQNFAKARHAATNQGLRAALKLAMQDLLDPEDRRARSREVRKILAKPKRFVKSYRFLEMEDDLEAQTSRVKMEVVVFTDALNKELYAVGLVSPRVQERAVVVLIRERSFTKNRPGTFWEYVPMSEVAVGQNLVGAGFKVLARDQIFGAVSEDLALQAVQGDITAAVDIGLRAGVEMVIVGTAVSTQLGSSRAGGVVAVQANLSVKAVAVPKSMVIAAKSDFATARAMDAMTGELKAFESAGKKIAEFLADAISRYWSPAPVAAPLAAAPPPEAPAAGMPAPSPGPPGLPEDL